MLVKGNTGFFMYVFSYISNNSAIRKISLQAFQNMLRYNRFIAFCKLFNKNGKGVGNASEKLRQPALL
ncbi:hypothetical protein BRYFOR_05813 [Marvinbryantia formatexigens DSM 14469]|uniref:Uncharacterized protein n=1 Tax=Marvinbryantia formatexigens DSM 14469 TaxID=478749 RepID=C6LB18_9FIRM|nr:hypothetical protein BRYFOR_05813 [Marvinbryantia formatexigens DSM 14469]